MAYTAVANIAKAQSGFSRTSMWPYNPVVYTDADFAPPMITDEAEGTTAASQTSPSTAWVSEQPADAVTEQPTASVSDQPAVSQKPTGSAMEAILKASPLPRCEKPRVRKRAAESSENLTGTPYKKKLLEKAEYGRQKLAKKSGKVQKVLNLNISRCPALIL